MMQLGELKSVNKSYVKTGGGKSQEYKGIKFRFNKKGDAYESGFTISDSLWKRLQLDSLGLKELTETDEEGNVTGVAIGTCSNEDAVFCKATKRNEDEEGNTDTSTKGRNFKNVILANHLGEAGLLDLDNKKGNQFLDVELIPGSEGIEVDGVTYTAIYQIVASADSDEAVEEEEVEEEEI